ncbi:hypothetical protein C8F04DRAFT_1198104 [Mycena alexandri]|uniref:Uncharacterized protein n=1 Tax=Mycena alexandri TaxID=1745969 RepID=A0AAD6S347_9AGAR|nr:hypothetical protein C8F04DRAFT_1198104 [Mycena alexandri]
MPVSRMSKVNMRAELKSQIAALKSGRKEASAAEKLLTSFEGRRSSGRVKTKLVPIKTAALIENSPASPTEMPVPQLSPIPTTQLLPACEAAALYPTFANSDFDFNPDQSFGDIDLTDFIFDGLPFQFDVNTNLSYAASLSGSGIPETESISGGFELGLEHLFSMGNFEPTPLADYRANFADYGLEWSALSPTNNLPTLPAPPPSSPPTFVDTVMPPSPEPPLLAKAKGKQKEVDVNDIVVSRRVPIKRTRSADNQIGGPSVKKARPTSTHSTCAALFRGFSIKCDTLSHLMSIVSRLRRCVALPNRESLDQENVFLLAGSGTAGAPGTPGNDCANFVAFVAPVARVHALSSAGSARLPDTCQLVAAGTFSSFPPISLTPLRKFCRRKTSGGLPGPYLTHASPTTQSSALSHSPECKDWLLALFAPDESRLRHGAHIGAWVHASLLHPAPPPRARICYATYTWVFTLRFVNGLRSVNASRSQDLTPWDFCLPQVFPFRGIQVFTQVLLVLHIQLFTSSIFSSIIPKHSLKFSILPNSAISRTKFMEFCHHRPFMEAGGVFYVTNYVVGIANENHLIFLCTLGRKRGDILYIMVDLNTLFFCVHLVPFEYICPTYCNYSPDTTATQRLLDCYRALPPILPAATELWRGATGCNLRGDLPTRVFKILVLPSAT